MPRILNHKKTRKVRKYSGGDGSVSKKESGGRLIYVLTDQLNKQIRNKIKTNKKTANHNVPRPISYGIVDVSTDELGELLDNIEKGDEENKAILAGKKIGYITFFTNLWMKDLSKNAKEGTIVNDTTRHELFAPNVPLKKHTNKQKYFLRSGAGVTLMNYMLEDLKKDGFTRIILHPVNKGLTGYYAQFGFVPFPKPTYLFYAEEGDGSVLHTDGEGGPLMYKVL